MNVERDMAAPEWFPKRADNDFRIFRRAGESTRNSILNAGLVHWNTIRGDKVIPSRSDFDPVSAPREILPHMILVDVVQDAPVRYRYRLVGTHITAAMQRDSTGRWLDALYDAVDYRVVTQGYFEAIKSLAPVHSAIQAPTHQRAFMTIEAIDMPMGDPDGTVNMIMALCHIRPSKSVC